MRQGIVLALVLVLCAVVSSSAAGQQPRASCPNGYDMAAVPQDEAAMRMFSRIADGLGLLLGGLADLIGLAFGSALGATRGGQQCGRKQTSSGKLIHDWFPRCDGMSCWLTSAVPTSASRG